MGSVLTSLATRDSTQRALCLLGMHAPAYLLMRGCWKDSKTRLQLSRHLFTPRISTKKSETNKQANKQIRQLCYHFSLRSQRPQRASFRTFAVSQFGYFWHSPKIHSQKPHRTEESHENLECVTKNEPQKGFTICHKGARVFSMSLFRLEKVNSS